MQVTRKLRALLLLFAALLLVGSMVVGGSALAALGNPSQMDHSQMVAQAPSYYDATTAQTDQPQDVAVSIANFAFSPQFLTVTVGTTVDWTNTVSTHHTVTADDNSFDSGDLAQNAVFTHTFSTIGMVGYHCMYHGSPGSSMYGTINVVAGGGTPTPTPNPNDQITGSAVLTQDLNMSSTPGVGSLNETLGGQAFGTDGYVLLNYDGGPNFVSCPCPLSPNANDFSLLSAPFASVSISLTRGSGLSNPITQTQSGGSLFINSLAHKFSGLYDNGPNGQGQTLIISMTNLPATPFRLTVYNNNNPGGGGRSGTMIVTNGGSNPAQLLNYGDGAGAVTQWLLNGSSTVQIIETNASSSGNLPVGGIMFDNGDGSATPTPSSTPIPTSTATPTSPPIPTSTATSAPTNTATSVPPTNTNTPAATSTPGGATNTPANTSTATSTNTPANTSTATNTPQPTNTPTSTSTPCGGNATLSFAPAANFSVGSFPHSLTVGDFNGDGKLDIVAANYASNTVSVLLGNGDGTFQAQHTFVVGSGPQSVAVGDFNGDGNADLATANISDNTVSVLLGNGDGTFQPQQTFAVGSNPRSLVVSDFNSDGKLDLATANDGSNTVSVLLGNGNGTFQAQQTFVVGSGPFSVAVGDFNGDGKPDLVAANYGDNDVSVLLGNGDGTFQSQQTFAVGSTPFSVAVGDFNGDGKPDLAVANTGSNTMSVLLGNGDGTFQPQLTFTVGYPPISVAVGDFNGDGKPDLATANPLNNNVSVLLGNGDGTFQSQQTFAVGSNPLSVSAGDFNGDGKPDLAIPNNGDNTVSVLLNTSSCATFTPTLTVTGTPPTNTPTNTPTITNTPGGPTNTPAATNTPGGPTNTPAATSTMTTTDTPAATSTMTATDTPAATSTMTATSTPVLTTTSTPMPSVTPTDCPNPFVDVSGDIFYGAIHYLNCRGVVNGTDATHYSPAGTSTRGQFAKVVVLGFGTPFYTPTSQDFVDVPPSYFAYLYIESGFHAGILSGFDQASCTAHGVGFPCYLPNIPITRGQLTKLVVNAGGYTLITPQGGTPDFLDVLPSNVFYVSIETAYHNGIVNGYPGHLFLPNNNIRRDEMAQIVYEGIINRPQ